MKRFVPAALLAGSLVVTSSAHAQSTSDRARAKEAYDRGSVAHKKGDFRKAAQEFARADAWAPSPVALQAAIDAAVEADDPALGSELLERSRRGPTTGGLGASVEAAKKKFAGRAGRVAVGCPASSKCTASLDGSPIEPKKPTWTRTGQHTVVVVVDGASQTREVQVQADATTDVPVTKGGEAPAAGASTPPATSGGQESFPEPIREDYMRDGFPPIVFWGGLGATVLLGGISTFFALDAKGKHSDFVEQGCDKAPEPGCDQTKSSGESAQTAANVGIAFTLIAGAATAVVGIWFTNWGNKKTKTPATTTASPVFAPTHGGGTFGLTGRF